MPPLAPVVILVGPQLGENIGTAARAMLNFGLTDLRLVRPRDGWPNDKARGASSGATAVIDGAKLFDNTERAIADLDYVLACTARPRDMTKAVQTPGRAAENCRMRAVRGIATGLLFGPEKHGLDNDDVTLADAIVSIPTNPGFASLNLAMSVLLLGYEWLRTAEATPAERLDYGANTRPATKQELLGFFGHLERELDVCGFLRVREMRPRMVRNIRNIFQRASLSEQEVRTLRGIVAGLTRRPRRADGCDQDTV